MKIKLTVPYTKYWDDDQRMMIRKSPVDYEDNDEGYLLGFVNRNTNYKINCAIGSRNSHPESMQVTNSVSIALVNYSGKVIEVESKWIEIL